jgi:hypothetical protein
MGDQTMKVMPPMRPRSPITARLLFGPVGGIL